MAKPLFPFGNNGKGLVNDSWATVMDSLPLDFSAEERETFFSLSAVIFSFHHFAVLLNFLVSDSLFSFEIQTSEIKAPVKFIWLSKIYMQKE